jgi:hypothetical protein
MEQNGMNKTKHNNMEVNRFGMEWMQYNGTK